LAKFAPFRKTQVLKTPNYATENPAKEESAMFPLPLSLFIRLAARYTGARRSRKDEKGEKGRKKERDRE